MPNVKPGNHPLTDIVVHGRRVYPEAADELERRIVALGGSRRIADLLLLDFNEHENPDVAEFGRRLKALHARLLSEAHERG